MSEETSPRQHLRAGGPDRTRGDGCRFAAASAVLLLAACGAENSSSGVRAPGAPETARTRALDAGAAALQDKPPIDALNAYLDGFHFYSGQVNAQMEAHHYCANVNEDVIQCVIYDGNVAGAKLMGIEYIVSGALFRTLPDDEKTLWHSHVHEVRSGQLIAPGIPAVAEKELMKKLVGTYGKTWHTWHTDQQKPLPLGVPQLMMGATADGQIDMARVAERDRRFQVSSEDKRKERADIPAPAVDPRADAWQKGLALQIADPRPNAQASPHAAAHALPHAASAAGATSTPAPK